MIDEIVKYCHEQYQKKPLFCENCDEFFCTKGCKQCLKDIHFDPNCHRNYDCPNMCYYYVCQDMYKYATEMAYLWMTTQCEYNLNNGQLNICSIGCGPCSELIALEEYCINKGDIPYTYIGFDIELNWSEIQNAIINISKHPERITFENCDAFEYYKSHDKPNVIILNYMLSNMLKNDFRNFPDFLQSLYTLFTEMPTGILLINDVNIGQTDKHVRYYYDTIINSIKAYNKNIKALKFHFKDSIKSYFEYGVQRHKSELLFKVPSIIATSYDTNTECHSAQLAIIKNN